MFRGRRLLTRRPMQAPSADYRGSPHAATGVLPSARAIVLLSSRVTARRRIVSLDPRIALALVLCALAWPGAAVAQDVANGQQLYQAYCEACHGSPPSKGPDRAPNDPARIRAAMTLNIPDMFALGFLTDAQLADIAAYIARALGVTEPPANRTALWWNPQESGWGLNLNHQGDILFGTLFTYDAAGAPLWLVLPAGALQAGTATYSGDLYRTTGPPFNAEPFTPIGAANLTRVGTMSVAFQGDDSATLTYSVNGVAVVKSIERQRFGSRVASCTPTTESRATATNFQDLWWNAAESGWGVNLTHQDNIVFATLFTYDATGKGLWLVMSAGQRQADGSYAGELYRTTGPAFNAEPFTPIGAANVTTVGTMRVRFSDGDNGRLDYTYLGAAVSKAITRQVFASPVPRCG